MSWLPKTPGLLPYFLLLDGFLSWYCTVQAYLYPQGLGNMYTGPNAPQNVTPLSTRMFGCWLILAGFVRFYAAYNLSNAGVYRLAYCTFVAISWHYLTEWLWFGTVELGATLATSLVMGVGALLWMWIVWPSYVV